MLYRELSHYAQYLTFLEVDRKYTRNKPNLQQCSPSTEKTHNFLPLLSFGHNIHSVPNYDWNRAGNRPTWAGCTRTPPFYSLEENQPLGRTLELYRCWHSPDTHYNYQGLVNRNCSCTLWGCLFSRQQGEKQTNKLPDCLKFQINSVRKPTTKPHQPD